MKSKTKALLMVLCALMLVVASVLGTIAYLTDSETVTNTFTVGNVQIKLDEAKVNLYGEQKDENGENTTERIPNETDTSTGNEYKLIPGHTYVKDPTVTVVKGSEETYVRMIVTVTDLEDVKAAFGTDASTGYFLPQNFVTGWDSSVWLTTNEVKEQNNTATYEFRYYAIVDARDANEDIELDALFDTFKVPGALTNAQIASLEEMEIKVEAHAIQADGFSSAELAWAAF